MKLLSVIVSIGILITIAAGLGIGDEWFIFNIKNKNDRWNRM
jgi:hypothetical protein